MERLALHDGAAAAFRIVDAANLFIAETQPWALAKDESQADRLTGVLSESAEAVRVAALLLLPVMPTSAREILRRVGDARTIGEFRLSDAAWRTGEEKRVLNEGPLWPRRDLGAAIVSETPKEPASAEPGAPVDPPAPPAQPGPPALGLTQAAAPAPADDRISLDEFMRVELRVAKNDIGKVIGKDGRTAQSLRTIVSAASIKIGRRAHLDIID